jgi:hypothetical protein
MYIVILSVNEAYIGDNFGAVFHGLILCRHVTWRWVFSEYYFADKNCRELVGSRGYIVSVGQTLSLNYAKCVKLLGEACTGSDLSRYELFYIFRDLVQIIMHTIKHDFLVKIITLLFTSWPHSEQCNNAINSS